jgi:hypothetical protein
MNYTDYQTLNLSYVLYLRHAGMHVHIAILILLKHIHYSILYLKNNNGPDHFDGKCIFFKDRRRLN